MRPYRSALALCLATSLTVSLDASAQTPASPADPARESFERGVAALQGGRMHDAARAFSESYAASPFPVVLYNLGLALRGEGRTVEAVDAFERYLRAPEPDASTELLATLRSEVARLRGELATLHVTVRTPRAVVLLDGQPVTRPLDDVLLTPGSHMIAVSASGYRSRQLTLALGAGQSESAEVTLEVPARLTVTPSVTEAMVSVDGQLQGVGVTVASLDPGIHRVEIRAAGYVPQRHQVFALRSGALRLNVTLAPTVAPPSRWWVYPVVAGGVALLAGAIIGAVLLAPAPVPEYPGTWATVRE